MLLHIGQGNFVNMNKVLSVVDYNSTPVHRDVQEAKKMGKLINATKGRLTKTVMYMTDGYILLSAIDPAVIFERYQLRKEG